MSLEALTSEVSFSPILRDKVFLAVDMIDAGRRLGILRKMIKLLDDEVGLSLPLGVNILGARAIRPFAVTDYYKDKFVGHLQITHDDIETIGERMGGKLRPHALLPGIVRIEYPSPAVEVSFTSATFICETRAEGSVGEVPYKGLTGRLSQGTDRLDVMTFELALPNIPQRQFTP